MKRLDPLVEICMQRGYVTQEGGPWLHYALEKRISSILAFAPLVIIGVLIVPPATALAFFVSFCLLRTRTNGFHAKTITRCILYSALGELVLLKILPTIWNDAIAFFALLIAIALIWFFAPYNHPNMNLSAKEKGACAQSSKRWTCILVFLLIIFHLWEKEQLALGILLGIIMTAFTLAIAFFNGICKKENNAYPDRISVTTPKNGVTKVKDQPSNILR